MGRDLKFWWIFSASGVNTRTSSASVAPPFDLGLANFSTLNDISRAFIVMMMMG
jgi:hypothetical protein